MVRPTIVAAVMALMIAGCVARPVSQAALQEESRITAARDQGTMSWVRWADRMSAIAHRDGLINDPVGEAAMLRIAVIAERVDRRAMTPAEGRLAVAETMAIADSSRAGGGAGGSPPQSTRVAAPAPRSVMCSRVLNSVMCNTY